MQNPIFPFKSTEENNNNKKMSFNLCSFQSLARMSHGELNEYWLCGPKLVTAVDWTVENNLEIGGKGGLSLSNSLWK